ncbi:hypothetical protein RFI_23911 [Reticulomyxa filosa]|uniref:Uncharacterized protein n=1 Tax=Reticulomyxa filosa TaxID=46433 RepID=X6MHX5_RETFI|nr:hypothetical protein RFI_23911 [Reticulomyxa filosa]|eukprot:ETO13459.1 hypothetical protein RFI_23911 [Reticulomyxa filosa]
MYKKKDISHSHNAFFFMKKLEEKNKKTIKKVTKVRKMNHTNQEEKRISPTQMSIFDLYFHASIHKEIKKIQTTHIPSGAIQKIKDNTQKFDKTQVTETWNEKKKVTAEPRKKIFLKTNENTKLINSKHFRLGQTFLDQQITKKQTNKKLTTINKQKRKKGIGDTPQFLFKLLFDLLQTFTPKKFSMIFF